MYNAPKDSTAPAKTDQKNFSKSDQAETVHDIANNLSSVANRVSRKVRTYYDAASDELSDDYELVATRIRNNPLQATAIALGVGVLLGALLRRS